jgi:hypothetical protein
MAEKINLPLDFFSGVNLSGINSDLYSDNPQTTGIDSSTKYNEGLLAGLIADILAAQDPSNYRYGGYVSQGGLDIGEPNRQVINATPEQIAEALSKSKDMATAVLGSTVGSNQMLDDADLAAAQSAAAPSSSAEGGGQEAETVDLGADTTANDLLTGGLGDADTGGVADVNETWTYDKDTDSFISNTRGDVFPNRGNATLKDGGIYAVTPVLGTDGVTAENVVDTETNESVGILNVDITTGLPSIIKTVDAGSSNNNNNNGGANNQNGGSNNNANGGSNNNANGGTNNNGTGGGAWDGSTKVITSTVGSRQIVDGLINNNGTKTTVINGADGTDGSDGNDGSDGATGATGATGGTGASGSDGRDGKDGKDGRDGIIGLFSAIQSTPLTESILFQPKFTELDNVQLGMFEQFLRAAGGR